MYHVAAFRSKKLSGESFSSSTVNVSNIHSFSDFAVASNKISHMRVHTPRATSERSEGRYLYDVRTEGGRGVIQYVTNTTDRLRECVTKGGEGVQNPENFADVLYVWSLTSAQ